MPRQALAWTVEGGEPVPLAAWLRARTGRSWRGVKDWISSGRVFVEGEPAADAGARILPGMRVEVRESAPRLRFRPRVRIVHDDPHVVVIDKPEGVSSVPYDDQERDTAMDLVRDAWKRQGLPSAPLLIVHRIDKDTSGLLCFAKTRRAERDLGGLFRTHEIARTYICVAHGDVRPGTIETRLVPDRGDGLRGTARRQQDGKLAITHVTPIRRLAGATLCEVRLETGKTHQIRIHLAERGHPLVGETVYIRDFLKAGNKPIPSPRLMLHAVSLGFRHPVTGAALAFRSELPPDFQAIVDGL